MRNLFLFLLIFACVACTKKLNVSQLMFNESLTNAYYEGEPFTGEAWSDDNKTICIICDGGHISSVKVYHENGNIAMDGVSLTSSGKTYDENGESITVQEFVKAYPNIISVVAGMTEGMYFDTSLE